MLLLASILLFQRPKTPQKDNQVQLRPMNGVIFRRLSTFFDTFANHVPRFIRITFVDCLPCYQYITNSYIDWEKCLMVSKIDVIHRTTKLHLIIRVCQMCQRFKIPIFSVKSPLVTSSYLYLYQKIGTFSKFRSPPKTFSVYTMVY